MIKMGIQQFYVMVNNVARVTHFCVKIDALQNKESGPDAILFCSIILFVIFQPNIFTDKLVLIIPFTLNITKVLSMA